MMSFKATKESFMILASGGVSVQKGAKTQRQFINNEN